MIAKYGDEVVVEQVLHFWASHLLSYLSFPLVDIQKFLMKSHHSRNTLVKTASFQLSSFGSYKLSKMIYIRWKIAKNRSSDQPKWLFHFCFLLRATRPISHYVGLSVCRSVCRSVGLSVGHTFLFLHFWAFWR